jgi:hypothetical protein
MRLPLRDVDSNCPGRRHLSVLRFKIISVSKVRKQSLITFIRVPAGRTACNPFWHGRPWQPRGGFAQQFSTWGSPRVQLSWPTSRQFKFLPLLLTRSATTLVLFILFVFFKPAVRLSQRQVYPREQSCQNSTSPLKKLGARVVPDTDTSLAYRQHRSKRQRLCQSEHAMREIQSPSL